MATRSWSLRPPPDPPPRSSSEPGGARGGTGTSPGSVAGRPADTTTPRAALDPLLMSWPTGEVIYRCCDVHRCCDVPRGSDVHRGCRNFPAGNATPPGRFQPCTADRRRTPPPVLYGAGDVDTALSETVFHDV